MPIPLATAITVFVAEIGLLALLFSKFAKRLFANGLIRVLLVSVLSVLFASLVPAEAWLGATLRSGWFEPWSLPTMLIGWVCVAVPAAAIFTWK